MLTSAGTRMHHPLDPTHSYLLKESLVPHLSVCPEGQFLFLPLSESVPGEEVANRSCSEKTGFSVQGFRCPDKKVDGTIIKGSHNRHLLGGHSVLSEGFGQVWNMYQVLPVVPTTHTTEVGI